MTDEWKPVSPHGEWVEIHNYCNDGNKTWQFVPDEKKQAEQIKQFYAEMEI